MPALQSVLLCGHCIFIAGRTIEEASSTPSPQQQQAGGPAEHEDPGTLPSPQQLLFDVEDTRQQALEARQVLTPAQTNLSEFSLTAPPKPAPLILKKFSNLVCTVAERSFLRT